ncbi:MAG: thiosulfate oxidation carrier protein SoxY [Hyphomicrobium sp.]
MAVRTATYTLMNRRAFVLAAGAGGLALPSWLQAAETAPAPVMAPFMERTQQFQDALSALLAGATPIEGKILVELPEIAENGNFVPLTVSVESPMTDADYVKSIHILSTANPVARVGSFHLSPVNGLAKVQSRMRLAKTQDVVALALQSNGIVLIATAMVKVTIGGCAS